MDKTKPVTIDICNAALYVADFQASPILLALTEQHDHPQALGSVSVCKEKANITGALSTRNAEQTVLH